MEKLQVNNFYCIKSLKGAVSTPEKISTIPVPILPMVCDTALRTFTSYSGFVIVPVMMTGISGIPRYVAFAKASIFSDTKIDLSAAMYE